MPATSVEPLPSPPDALWPLVKLNVMPSSLICSGILEQGDLCITIVDDPADALRCRKLPDVSTVELYFQIGGSAELRREALKPITFTAGQSAVIMHCPTNKAEWHASDAQDSFVSVTCSTAFFALLIDRGRNADSHARDKAADLQTVTMMPGATIRRLADELFHARMDLPLRDLLLRAKAIELLYAGALAVNRRPAARSPLLLSERDIDRLNATKRMIRSQLCEAPTIPELARRVGLNQQKLKVGFKHIFGQTIFEYTLQERMETARHLLEVEELPVKAVAYNVGYRCATSFSRAFERHWGFLPRSLKGLGSPMHAESHLFAATRMAAVASA